MSTAVAVKAAVAVVAVVSVPTEATGLVIFASYGLVVFAPNASFAAATNAGRVLIASLRSFSSDDVVGSTFDVLISCAVDADVVIVMLDCRCT